MALQIRRGLEADRTTVTPQPGEPLYTTDTNLLYVGDGSTAGGVAVGGGGNLTIDTQDFTASGTWTKPPNAVWVEVTMCGAGQDGFPGNITTAGLGGSAGVYAERRFLAADLPSTVSVTCGARGLGASDARRSFFGTYLCAVGAAGGPNDANAGMNPEYSPIMAMAQLFGSGASADTQYDRSGNVGWAGGGGGAGGWNSAGDGLPPQTNGGAGGKAGTPTRTGVVTATGGGGAGGAGGATGSAGSAGGYDPITGFGHGGGGGGEGTSGAGGAGGAAVRGGGGGGGGKCATGTSAGGAGGDGFVRVRTMCFG